MAQALHASCASLNIASKAVQEETSRILWRRALYKWNNSKNRKKRSAIKWRTVFASKAAKYIQYVRGRISNGNWMTLTTLVNTSYVMAIPLHPPAVNTPNTPWEPPFLSLILATNHALKSCIVAGASGELGVLLYTNYRPCTSDGYAIMDCARLIRQETCQDYTAAVVRPIFSEAPREHLGPLSIRDLSSCFARNATFRPSCGACPPIIEVGLVLSTWDFGISDKYIAHLMIDTLSWMREGAVAFRNGPHDEPHQEEGIVSIRSSLRWRAFGTSYVQARAMAKAVSCVA